MSRETRSRRAVAGGAVASRIIAPPDPVRAAGAASSLGLARTQVWMHAVVAARGDIDTALGHPDALALVPADAVESVVKRSATLSPRERMAIYHGMYDLRMEEALASDYPALKHYLGDDRFLALVRDYIDAFPSTSYTLNRLGDHLPGFAGGWSAAADDEERSFLADLASFELAISQSFDADESIPLDADTVARIPGDELEALVLAPCAAVRLVRSRFELGIHLDASRGDAPARSRCPLRPRRRARIYLVFRRDYSVRRIALGAAEGRLLETLLAGIPLGAAVEATATRHRGARDPERVFGWFRRWVGFGIFRA